MLTLLGWLAPLAASGQTPLPMDTLSLYQLPGVLVVVDSVDRQATEDGFDVDSLRALMIAKLDDARIKVLTGPEWQVTYGNPMLYVALNLSRVSPFLYLYGLEVELRQLASSVRDSSPVFVPTWRSGISLGSVRTDRLWSLASMVLDATDRFISAFAAAHRPRPRFPLPASRYQPINSRRRQPLLPGPSIRTDSFRRS